MVVGGVAIVVINTLLLSALVGFLQRCTNAVVLRAAVLEGVKRPPTTKGRTQFLNTTTANRTGIAWRTPFSRRSLPRDVLSLQPWRFDIYAAVMGKTYVCPAAAGKDKGSTSSFDSVSSVAFAHAQTTHTQHAAHACSPRSEAGEPLVGEFLDEREACSFHGTVILPVNHHRELVRRRL